MYQEAWHCVKYVAAKKGPNVKSLGVERVIPSTAPPTQPSANQYTRKLPPGGSCKFWRAASTEWPNVQAVARAWLTGDWSGGRAG
jgi:hypothetical protein